MVSWVVDFYRSFCKDFCTVDAPLTDLLKSTVTFVWTPEGQIAFDLVKTMLGSVPVLAAPRLSESFKLQVDASMVGAGAVLLQEVENGTEIPVCFLFNY